MKNTKVRTIMVITIVIKVMILAALIYSVDAYHIGDEWNNGRIKNDKYVFSVGPDDIFELDFAYENRTAITDNRKVERHQYITIRGYDDHCAYDFFGLYRTNESNSNGKGKWKFF